MIKLNTNQFFWDSEDKTFSQEISTLRNFLDSTFELINDDGIGVVMNLGTVTKDAEGDIQSWTFYPQSPELQFKLVVWND